VSDEKRPGSRAVKKSATRDLSDVIAGMGAGLDQAIRTAEALLMELQPEHWHQYDIGWNAGLEKLIGQLKEANRDD